MCYSEELPLIAKYIQPSNGWDRAAEGNVGIYYCQLRTGNRGYVHCAKVRPNWTVEYWKNVAMSDVSQVPVAIRCNTAGSILHFSQRFRLMVEVSGMFS